mmetsp:Transcript_171435/g.549515  ORF Transcript_171435/g.549515 Transcript_171435/m.549515 type:complete len:236 (+) Transcript_171435:123-830(+)
MRSRFIACCASVHALNGCLSNDLRPDRRRNCSLGVRNSIGAGFASLHIGRHGRLLSPGLRIRHRRARRRSPQQADQRDEPETPEGNEEPEAGELQRDDENGQQNEDGAHDRVHRAPRSHVNDTGLGALVWARLGLLAQNPADDRYVGHNHHCRCREQEADEVDVQVMQVRHELAGNYGHHGDRKADLGRECVGQCGDDANEKDGDDRQRVDGIHVLQEVEDPADVRQLRRDDERQ